MYVLTLTQTKFSNVWNLQSISNWRGKIERTYAPQRSSSDTGAETGQRVPVLPPLLNKIYIIITFLLSVHITLCK